MGPSPPDRRDAYCAGRPVLVSARTAPPDHRKVGCPSCGVTRGLDCVVIGSPATVLYQGHQARIAKASLLYKAQQS